MNFSRRKADEPDINLIPFIDVLLVVLIFLMLSTTYSRFTELQVALPTANAETLKDRTPEADGYVTAAEWPAYDLKSELVVLSACDSGVGKVVSGEGVMGLPFAMFVAGNVNTILSLWPVDDKATAEFVTRLFEHLQAGQGAAQALAATKREFARHRRYGHPAYWAPFVLVGAG